MKNQIRAQFVNYITLNLIKIKIHQKLHYHTPLKYFPKGTKFLATVNDFARLISEYPNKYLTSSHTSLYQWSNVSHMLVIASDFDEGTQSTTTMGQRDIKYWHHNTFIYLFFGWVCGDILMRQNTNTNMNFSPTISCQ